MSLQRNQALPVCGRDDRAVGEAGPLEGIDDAALVPRQLQVHDELEVRVRGRGEVVKRLLQRERGALGRILVVVGEDQLVRLRLRGRALGQHVQLDHVHPVRERGIEAGERVPRLDQVRTLVTDAPHEPIMEHRG